MKALLPIKNMSWPYPGRIGIREYSTYNHITDIHVFDQWCYLGVAHNEEELSQLKLCQESEFIYDLDMYKILINRFNIIQIHMSYVLMTDKSGIYSMATIDRLA